MKYNAKLEVEIRKNRSSVSLGRQPRQSNDIFSVISQWELSIPWCADKLQNLMQSGRRILNFHLSTHSSRGFATRFHGAEAQNFPQNSFFLCFLTQQTWKHLISARNICWICVVIYPLWRCHVVTNQLWQPLTVNITGFCHYVFLMPLIEIESVRRASRWT